MTSTRLKNTVLAPVSNERGIALVIAISLLAVMSILGAMLITASTSEIKLSGNYRNNREAFYAAERGLAYAMQEITDNDFTVNNTTIDLSADAAAIDAVRIGNAGMSTTPGASTVTFIGTTDPPAEFRSDASSFETRNFIVTTSGVAPLNATNPSRIVVSAHVSRLVPKAN